MLLNQVILISISKNIKIKVPYMVNKKENLTKDNKTQIWFILLSRKSIGMKFDETSINLKLVNKWKDPIIHEWWRIFCLITEKIRLKLSTLYFFIQAVVSFATGRNVMHKGDVKFFVCLETDAVKNIKFSVVCAFT